METLGTFTGTSCCVRIHGCTLCHPKVLFLLWVCPAPLLFVGTEPVLSPGVTAVFSADLHPVFLRPLWQAELWDAWPTGADSVQHFSLVPASGRATEHVA